MFTNDYVLILKFYVFNPNIITFQQLFIYKQIVDYKFEHIAKDNLDVNFPDS